MDTKRGAHKSALQTLTPLTLFRPAPDHEQHSQQEHENHALCHTGRDEAFGNILQLVTM